MNIRSPLRTPTKDVIRTLFVAEHAGGFYFPDVSELAVAARPVLELLRRKNVSSEVIRPANTSAALHPLLAQRWSPRSFDASHHVGDLQLTNLLEAARWTPSAMNSQPWRFVVARRGEAAFQPIFEALADGNQLWAGRASALIVVGAMGDQELSASTAYDVGQAVAMFVVQAESEGLATHQMGGFDRRRLPKLLGLDGGFHPLVVVAVGKLGAVGQLPKELAERERSPRVRKPLAELVLDVAPAVSAEHERL